LATSILFRLSGILLQKTYLALQSFDFDLMKMLSQKRVVCKYLHLYHVVDTLCTTVMTLMTMTRILINPLVLSNSS